MGVLELPFGVVFFKSEQLKGKYVVLGLSLYRVLYAKRPDVLYVGGIGTVIRDCSSSRKRMMCLNTACSENLSAKDSEIGGTGIGIVYRFSPVCLVLFLIPHAQSIASTATHLQLPTHPHAHTHRVEFDFLRDPSK